MEPKKMKLFDYKEVDFYSNLISDYLSGELKNKGLIDWDYTINQLEKNKSREYSLDTRKVVHEELTKQYSKFDLTTKEAENLSLFSKENTFTITTGHQLMLLGGPMFFYTKIIDVIKLCKELSTVESPVLPIFWMASEDHDYEEISKVNLFGKLIQCPGENKGPVGRMSAQYFEVFLEQINELLGDGDQYAEIKLTINKAFREGVDLSEITRIFVRELFKEDGLLIIDGDNKGVKSLFKPIVEKELFEKVAHKSSEAHIALIGKDYKVQVTPRELNLFYIDNEIRQRIVEAENGFSTSEGTYSWSVDEMKSLIDQNPEKISPNVILRPVYQEVLLPNLAYVGGAGEIAYWLELKPVFDEFKIDFPTPLVRTPYFVFPEKNAIWLQEQKIDFLSLFGDIDILVNKVVKSLSGDEISFEKEFEELKSFYGALKLKGKRVQPQLEKMILGEEKRAFSSLQNVEKRFVKADKQKHEQVLNKLRNIKGKLFPNNKPMERVDSFIPFLVNSNINFRQQLLDGPSLIDKQIIILKS